MYLRCGQVVICEFLIEIPCVREGSVIAELAVTLCYLVRLQDEVPLLNSLEVMKGELVCDGFKIAVLRFDQRAERVHATRFFVRGNYTLRRCDGQRVTTDGIFPSFLNDDDVLHHHPKAPLRVYVGTVGLELISARC